MLCSQSRCTVRAHRPYAHESSCGVLRARGGCFRPAFRVVTAQRLPCLAFTSFSNRFSFATIPLRGGQNRSGRKINPVGAASLLGASPTPGSPLHEHRFTEFAARARGGTTPAHPRFAFAMAEQLTRKSRMGPSSRSSSDSAFRPADWRALPGFFLARAGENFLKRLEAQQGRRAVEIAHSRPRKASCQ